MKTTRKRFFTTVLGCFVTIFVRQADGQVFTSDVRVQNTNPDFILDDTDGAQWALEGGEPLPRSFSISQGGTSPPVLVLENNAPANSLRIDSLGQVGLGTGNPIGDLNIFDVNGSGNASIRFDQGDDHWDILASDTFGFRIQYRDNSKLSIAPDAPFGSISASSDGVSIGQGTLFVDRVSDAVGINNFLPAATLHISDFFNDAKILVEESSSPVQKRTLLELANNGSPELRFVDSALGATWQLNPNVNGNFIINSIGLGGGSEFTINASNGNTLISGELRADDFIVTSSRNVKENFQAIDPEAILQKVVELPISQWCFKEDPSQRHVGPIAEDFQEAFGLGGDSKRISMVDVNGVALASIQGLKAQQVTEARQTRDLIAKLKDQITESNSKVNKLRAELAELKQLISKMSPAIDDTTLNEPSDN